MAAENGGYENMKAGNQYLAKTENWRK